MMNDTVRGMSNVVALKDMQEVYLAARREQEQELLALDYAYEQWLDTLDMQEERTLDGYTGECYASL